MRTLFLLNPTAGKADCTRTLPQQINVAAARAGLAPEEYTIQVTNHAGHARELANAAAQQARQSGEELRVFTAGGDGTFNEALTGIYGYANAAVGCLPFGSGNDFLHDLGKKPGDAPCLITEYIQNLPVAEVNGKRYRILNGVGYGIDGYCCEVGDKLRATAPGKPINYAGIAIKGLLFHYPPKNAVVTVDGVAHRYKKTWLAPTMNGRYYGGGMMPTPEQHRGNADGTVSTMIMAGSGKLRTLMIFPSIFKGEHVNYKRTVHVLTGKTIKVEFDRPTALQIDGETILGVKEYTVYGGNKNAARQTMAESAATV